MLVFLAEWWSHVDNSKSEGDAVVSIILTIIAVFIIICILVGVFGSSSSTPSDPPGMRNKKARYDKNGNIKGYEDYD